MRLTPPRLLTMLVSLAIVAVTIVSLQWRIPTIGRFVASHRLELLVAGYVVLLLGVIVDGL